MPLDAEIDPQSHPLSGMQQILYVEDDAALARWGIEATNATNAPNATIASSDAGTEPGDR